MRKFVPTFLGLLLLIAQFLPTTFGASKPVIVIDPTLGQDELAAWLGYAGARSAYREQHKIPSPSSGEVVPTFDEEVEARSMAALFLGLSNSRGGSYWDAVAKVGRAGFLKEYVWTYFRRPSWPANQAPKNLAAFEKWRRANLKDHRPETRVKLMAP